MDNQTFNQNSSPIPAQQPIASPAIMSAPIIDQKPPKNTKIPIITLSSVTAILLIIIIIGATNLFNSRSQITTLQKENADLSQRISNLTKVYLQPENWPIKFLYPDGVTDIQYSTINSQPNEIIITSITKDGVTYDSSLCKNESSSANQPFYLGTIQYSNPSVNIITNDNLTQFLALQGNEYYASKHGSCYDQNQTNTDYLIAENIFNQLINNIVY